MILAQSSERSPWGAGGYHGDLRSAFFGRAEKPTGTEDEGRPAEIPVSMNEPAFYHATSVE